MVNEISYGIIPIRKKDSGWEICIVKHCSGHWSFPKGHPEKGESPLETATRELKEETNLDVHHIVSEETLEEKYVYRFKGELRNKTVKYYIAEVEGELKILPKELQEGKWFSIDAAAAQVTFPQARTICQALQLQLHDAR
jgi:8-oxo-dGTP pyrophosphatase MutT (NUDIX family)